VYTASVVYSGDTDYNGASPSAAENVTVTPAPDFSVTATTETLSVVQGSPATDTVSVNPINSFNGNVAVSCSGLPTGAACSFSSSPVVIPTPRGLLGTQPSVTSTLTLTTLSSTPAGTYTVNVTGTSGTLTHTYTVTLVVNP
jgi:hypothetical protein